MPQGYYRNVDDGTSDPELIAQRYRVGPNIYFEVALTLAEYADNIKSAGGGSSSQTPTYFEAGGYEGGGDIGPGGCPEVNQYILVGEPGDEDPRAVKAKMLLNGTWYLFNPLNRAFNLMTDVELQENVPLLRQSTGQGASGRVSYTHKNIRNTQDLDGTPLVRMPLRSEVLIARPELRQKDKQWHIFQDMLTDVRDEGRGDVVKVSLAAEYIYACGDTKDELILAHNRKIGELETI